ncbi:hypothetical protein GCM10009678_85380 [Actinomadura kijaniata]|uniref:M23 family metallopeptidase n=1 Tax=Actinomadura kijaniata TaxID=46161 RepID=UPI002FE94014
MARRESRHVPYDEAQNDAHAAFWADPSARSRRRGRRRDAEKARPRQTPRPAARQGVRDEPRRDAPPWQEPRPEPGRPVRQQPRQRSPRETVRDEPLTVLPWDVPFDAREWGASAPDARRAAPRAERPQRPEPPPRRPEPPRAPARRRPPARRPHGPADRLGTGALVLSIMVGLGLLAVVERTLLEGGPICGTDTLGAQGRAERSRPRATRPAQDPPRTAPARPDRDRGGAPAPVPDVQALTDRVRRITLQERGAAARQKYGAAGTAQPIVGTDRISRDRTWAFGTTTIPVPDDSAALPEVAFFAARWTPRSGWQAALSGTSGFGALLTRMPPALMSADEARALNRHATVTAEQAAAAVNGARAGDGLILPWRVGATWSMGAVPTRNSPRPLGSLTFWGGDGTVTAAGDGRLYRFCSAGGGGLVLLVHPSGLATTYYRMRDVVRVRPGSLVRRGEPLGRTGTQRPCGGAPAPRPDVQFGLRRGADDVPFEGARLGGWTFRERAAPLLGFAERGDIQVLTGGLLANLGLAAGPARSGGPKGERPAKKPANDKRRQREDPQQ